MVDNDYSGLAFEEEGERCARMLKVPSKKVMIMGSHGGMVIRDSVADTFNRMYYFERASSTYIKALQTGKKLRILSNKVATRVAYETENYHGFAEDHLKNIMIILDKEASEHTS